VFSFLKHLAITLLLVVVLWNEALYMSSQSVTVAWDPVAEATSYEVRVVWQGSSGNKLVYDKGSTTATQLIVERPRTGHFMFEVRACNDVGCSEWSQSINPECATVDGVARGWRVYFEMPAPSGGGVE